MNRGAWRRLMRLGSEWTGKFETGRSDVRRKKQQQEGLKFGAARSEFASGFRDLTEDGQVRVRDVAPPCCGQGKSPPAGWQAHFMPPRCVRYYAAPLSRTGKAAQNPARQQRVNPDAPPEPDKPDRKLNRAIVARTIRLITDDGHEVITRMEALKRAEALDLDLVEVDGKQDPPVCKLMNFNQEKFKERQREKELKKKQSERRRLDDLKEVRFSTRTEQNDLELKGQMATRLLLKGHRVKLAVIPHGNDDLELKGKELIQRMITMLQDTCKVETGPRIERQRAWVLVRPTGVGDRSVSKRKRDMPTTIGGPGGSGSSDEKYEDDKELSSSN